jgi:hypothetical protein
MKLGRCFGAIAVLLVGTLPVLAQTNGAPERFTAMAVNMTNHTFGKTYTAQIVIDRWATERESADFMAALGEADPQGALKMLEGRDRIGFLQSTNLGFDLTLALQGPLPDGGRRVIVISPRHLRPDEGRIGEYPFMAIELKLGTNNNGEGTMSTAAKLSLDKDGHTIDVETFGDGAVMLKGVETEKR